MKTVMLLILNMLISLFMGFSDMSHVFSRALKIRDYDSAGIIGQISGVYILEWLRRNHAPNPGFENWAGGVNDPPDDYTKSSGTVTKVAGYAGSNALQLNTSTTVYTINYFRFAKNKPYRFTGYFATQATAGQVIQVSLILYDSLGSTITIENKQITLTHADTNFYLASTIWTLEDLAYNDIYYARLYITNIPANSDLITVDNITLTTYNPHELEEYDDFALLNITDKETFTFVDEPLITSGIYNQDDSVRYFEMEDGTLRTEKIRDARMLPPLTFRLYSKEQIEQLRRFHKKTRGECFYWTDSNGRQKEVIWQGEYLPQLTANPNIATVQINLREAVITPGE